jgi:hypothetical protein
MKLDNIRSGVGALWDTMTEGWGPLAPDHCRRIDPISPGGRQGRQPHPSRSGT